MTDIVQTWLGGLIGKRSKRSPAELSRLLQELQAENAELQHKVATNTADGDYLYVQQPGPLASSGLASDWHRRYFSLHGQTLTCQDRHDSTLAPNEAMNVTGCTVEFLNQQEVGVQGTLMWGLALANPSGAVTLLLAAPDRNTALHWAHALEVAGCTRRTALDRTPTPPSSTLSSTSSPDVSHADYPVLTNRRSEPDLHSSHEHHDDDSSVCTNRARRRQGFKLDPKTAAEQPYPDTASESQDRITRTSTEASQDEDLKSRQHHSGGRHHRVELTGSSPIHKASSASLLSSERAWNTKHTGMYNLMVLILLVTQFRLALENAIKYGLRYNPIQRLRDLTIANPNIPLAMTYPVLACLAVLSLLAEMLAYNLLQREFQLKASLIKAGVSPESASRQVRKVQNLHEWCLWVVNFVITTASLAVPWAVISVTEADPVPGGLLIMLAIVMWMKLVSYHHCCHDLRQARRAGQFREGERGCPTTPAGMAVLSYPENLTASHMAYFLAAPTLCYQVNYPTSGPIRWKWLARRVGELAVMLTFFSILVQQYMEPAIANSMQPLTNMDWPRLCERLLKLALPNTYCWLAMFYCLFHLWLNILAELLRFGDREFYKDWWNAPTLEHYWRLWNMPVHNWLVRHVLFPCERLGMPRSVAKVVVFLVSAVFHEVALGVPLHCLRCWAFLGIAIQIPVMAFTKKMRAWLKRDEAGNIVFWLTFCVVGQPLSILLYAHDYMYKVRPYLMQPQ